MGTAGVGKSFVIRALEKGLWRTAQEKYGAERYPTVRSVVRLAAFTGKAAYQIGGVTIHSLLKVGKYPQRSTTPSRNTSSAATRSREYSLSVPRREEHDRIKAPIGH